MSIDYDLVNCPEIRPPLALPCGPGVGKAHLTVAIGISAIEHGYGLYFTSMHRLLEDLRVAHEERRLEWRMRVYLAPKLLTQVGQLSR